MQYKLTIKIPIYNCVCSVIFAENIEELITKHLKKEDLGELGGLVAGYMISPTNISKYFIYYKLSELNINVVCHEISHLIDHILQDREVAWEGGEARAYLTGYVSEQIIEFILKKQIKISKWLKVKAPVSNQSSNSQENKP